MYEDNCSEYYVEKILDKRLVDGKYSYLIKWDGYDYNDCTWEKEENLEGSKDLLNEFKQQREEEIGFERKITDGKIEINKLNNNFWNSVLMCAEENALEALVNKDVPVKILFFKKHKGKLYFQVRWKKRENGKTPRSNYVPNAFLRQYHYNLLFEYYESKLVFLSEKPVQKVVKKEKD